MGVLYISGKYIPNKKRSDTPPPPPWKKKRITAIAEKVDESSAADQSNIR